jgi:hypothetical protein
VLNLDSHEQRVFRTTPKGTLGVLYHLHRGADDNDVAQIQERGRMIHLQIVVNEDGTHTLQVTGDPEDVAAITSFLVVSLKELEVGEVPEEGDEDLVG